MATVPLPPVLRRIQQSWLYQALLVPFVVGFGGFLLADGCLSGGVFSVSPACLKTAFSAWVVSAITVFVSGKSVGTPEFKADGTPNKTVENIVTVQQAAIAGRPEMNQLWTRVADQAGEAADKIKAAP